MIQQLHVTGGELRYEGRGFGARWEDIQSGVIRDVDWGPKPGRVELEVVGAGRATKVRWSVAFRIPVCDDAVFTGIREFNFTVTHDGDGSGYTTRTYTATLKIAQSKLNARARTLQDTADAYYEQTIPGRIPGFHPRPARINLLVK